jgi:two-component system sensor histidine kinase VicK
MQPQIQPDLQVEFDSPLQPLMANVDPKHVEQILRNLLTNAIKYSPDGGTITIEVEQNKKELIVQFKDQGIGIPAADLKKIFERFYRVDNDITRDVSGAGLGLAISRELVEAHGGRMWAESEWGTGSTFYFTLPTKEGIRD